MNHRSFLPLVIWLLAFAASAAPQSSQFKLREPHLRGYTLEPRPFSRGVRGAPAAPEEWLTGHPDYDPNKTVEFGRRLLVRMQPGKNVNDALGNSPLQFVKAVNQDSFIFQAADAMTALQEADRLSQSPDVAVCVPVMRRPMELHSYAPNDPYLARQWNLSNTTNAANLNIRPAWDLTRGNGVAMAIVDDGVELIHSELNARSTGMPHHNFLDDTSNGAPVSDTGFGHGTSVAGLAVAQGNNSLGIVGAAPEAKFASWVIFGTNNSGAEIAASSEQLMDMFQFNLSAIAIQNHSWGNEKTEAQEPIDPFAKLGIDNAIENGRGGRGIIMVRSVGNYRYFTEATSGQVGRKILANANDDGYPSDRRVIAVAAVNSTGRATRYSNPGACILVAAPGTEWNANNDSSPDVLHFPSLFMVDRKGAKGYNTDPSAAGDYTFSNNVVIGTSFAAPQIAGLAALMLSVNTNLTYRDVQQILLLSARHFDLTDPDLTTNGAGLAVSHNVGFGIPDAAAAVNFAKSWVPRPPLKVISFTNENSAEIIDDGLRVIVSNAPSGLLSSIPGSPTTGIHADVPTAILPLVDVGLAATVPTNNLTGKAALMLRGGTFATKIQNVAKAGAAFAIIYNTNSTTDRIQYSINPDVTLPMTDTDFSPIPAIFINGQNGEALRAFNATNPAYVQIKLLATNFTFTVTNQFSCEHIEVDVDGDNIASPNSRRGDLRITLLSPSGTRSILQRLNTDTNRVTSPAWTYQSTHHFFENSEGTWTVAVSDEAPGATATIRSVVLRIYGTDMAEANQPSDFDGNGSTDLLLQNPAGLMASWLMKPDGTNILKSIALNKGLPTPGWHVVGVADFDKDNNADLLFQNNDSRLAIWFMRGTNLISSALVRNGLAPGAAWKAVAAADFNNDSFPDILFQSTSGGLAVWYQRGVTAFGSAPLKSVGPGWRVIGLADMSLDGYTDILFQNAGGQVALWSMKGITFLRADVLKSISPGWNALGLADLNHDGKTDILFQSTSGVIAAWYMNGKTFLSAGVLNVGKSTGAWRLVGPK